jgi:hypothetical protein
MDSLIGIHTRLFGDATFISCGDHIVLRRVIVQCITEYRINIFLLNWESISELGACRIYTSSYER